MQQIRRDPKEITPAFHCIHLRQLSGQETAIALLQQVIGNVRPSRYTQKIGPQRTAGPTVENAKGFPIEVRPVNRIDKRVSRGLWKLDTSRASVWPNAHGLRTVFRGLGQQPERFRQVVRYRG